MTKINRTIRITITREGISHYWRIILTYFLLPRIIVPDRVPEFDHSGLDPRCSVVDLHTLGAKVLEHLVCLSQNTCQLPDCLNVTQLSFRIVWSV